MALTIEEHLDEVVLPAIRDYWVAEAELSQAAANGDSSVVVAARAQAMRRARTASSELHHLSDFALHSADLRVASAATIENIRMLVETHCVFSRSSNFVADVSLLRDVADAFKHQKLDRKNVRVAGADAVIACQSGYGRLSFGEGKFGGTDQVVITDKAGSQRALSSVIQNVVDAWRSLLGHPLPPMNDFN